MKNFSIPFANFPKRLRQRPANRGIVFTHWDRETIDYLLVTPGSQQLASSDIGSVPRADHANPLKALAEHFAQQQLSAARLVVLLSRPELDQLQLELPPADALELPALVASAVEEQLGEADDPPRVDYLAPSATQAASESSSQRVLAFALSAAELSNLQTQCTAAGFSLTAIGARHLSPLAVLQRRPPIRGALTIAMHVYAAEVELVICTHTTPLLLRSIRINPEEPTRVAEQIWLETQRCLTLLPEETVTDELAWCIFSTSESACEIARALEDRGLTVQTLDPFLGWELTSPRLDNSATQSANEATASGQPSPPQTSQWPRGASAANTGAAWEFLGSGLPVNLLAPKRAPAPPNPYLRWGIIGSAAALVLAVGVGFLLSDVRSLETQVAELEQQVAEAKQLTAKYQSKADQVAYVEGWLADQVDWLAELTQLSQRLPQGQNATVRRLTATTAADRAAVFDLSVQVARQEHISELEQGIRSAKYATSSKSINQQADESEYPWQFETRITFAIDPPDPKAYQPSQTSEDRP